MENKDKIIQQALNDDELDNVAGGGCWFGAKDVAPDGHDIGCRISISWYENWDEYNYRHNICKYCGGELDKEKVFSSCTYKVCKKCGWGNDNEWE